MLYTSKRCTESAMKSKEWQIDRVIELTILLQIQPEAVRAMTYGMFGEYFVKNITFDEANILISELENML